MVKVQGKQGVRKKLLKVNLVFKGANSKKINVQVLVSPRRKPVSKNSVCFRDRLYLAKHV